MEPWWASKLAAGEVAWWLTALDGERLSQLPGKQRVGLVNALGDLLRHLVCRSERSLAFIRIVPGLTMTLCWATQHRVK